MINLISPFDLHFFCTRRFKNHLQGTPVIKLGARQFIRVKPLIDHDEIKEILK